MKSLRDEIRLAAGDMDGFNFIQAFGLDFICVADFILAKARISLKDAQPGVISMLAAPSILILLSEAIDEYKMCDYNISRQKPLMSLF